MYVDDDEHLIKFKVKKEKNHSQMIHFYSAFFSIESCSSKKKRKANDKITLSLLFIWNFSKEDLIWQVFQ